MFRLNEKAFYVVLVKVDILITATTLKDGFITLAFYGDIFLARQFGGA